MGHIYVASKQVDSDLNREGVLRGKQGVVSSKQQAGLTSSGTVQGAPKPDSGGNEEQQVVGSSHVQQTGCSGTV